MSDEFIGVYIRLLFFASSIVLVYSNTHAILSDFTLITLTFQVGVGGSFLLQMSACNRSTWKS